MPLDSKDRCPGTGVRMIPRSFRIREITASDREENALRIVKAEERGDHDEAAAIRNAFAKWESEQGHDEERLTCAVCGDWWLTPTRSSTTRPHRRSVANEPTWDKVRQLRKQINALQHELDRLLEALEPD